MLKLLISCWYDGVVVACRYMFAMGSDVVLVLLLLYCVLCTIKYPQYKVTLKYLVLLSPNTSP